MSDQDSLFKDTPNTANVEGKTDAPNDLLGSIKNEHGEQKYKSVEDALVALKNAQEFIPTLQTEKRELEKRYTELEGKVSKIDALEQALLELSNKKQEANDQKPNDSRPESITKQMLEEYLRDRETAAERGKNLQSVVSAVKQTYGDQSEAVFYQKAEELGMSKEEMNSLAAKNPKLVLKILDISGEGANRQPQRFSPSGSEINTAGLKGKQPPVIKRPEKSIMLGATTSDIFNEAEESLKMVEAMHEQGMSVHDLSNPSLYFKMFGK